MKRLLLSILAAISLIECLGACAKPQDVTAPTATIIKDLSNIRITAMSSNWDADPDDDGIAIGIFYYNSKGQTINFSNTPLLVNIEFYGYRNFADMYSDKPWEFICQTHLAIDHSMRQNESSGNYIRIPFESIAIDPSHWYVFGRMVVTLTTPNQGDFQAIKDMLRLYPGS